jgi:BASS family bile acid:Na+ symporter
MSLLDVMTLAFQLSLVLTVFSFGLRATRKEIFFAVRQPRLLLLSLIALFVVTPVLALAVVTTFEFGLAATVAIVAITLSPLPPGLPAKELEAGGDASYGLGLMVWVSLLSIVIVPAMVAFIGNVMSRPFELSPWAVAGVVVWAVLVPHLVGIGIRAMMPERAERLGEAVARIAGILTLAAVLILFVAVIPAVWGQFSGQALLAIVLVVVGSLGIGHLMGGPDPNQSLILALSCANRNPSIALTIASSNYPAQHFGVNVLLFMLVSSVLTSVYLVWHRRRNATPLVPAPAPA